MKWTDFLYSEGSEDHDRDMACSLQHQKGTYESGYRLPATETIQIPNNIMTIV
jgi:hypothetical protein